MGRSLVHTHTAGQFDVSSTSPPWLATETVQRKGKERGLERGSESWLCPFLAVQHRTGCLTSLIQFLHL